MLIPSFNSISMSLKSLYQSQDKDQSFRYILSIYLSQWDFNEEWYLSNYTDLANAIPSKDFPTGSAHFRSVGYMEGRLPVKPEVDATWYMENYPDVSAAIVNGIFESAAVHFRLSGYLEGRLCEAPDIDISWYARTYIAAGSAAATLAECTEHFKTIGYVGGAIPRLKRPTNKPSGGV